MRLPTGEGVRSPLGPGLSGAWAALRVPWYLRGAALEGLVRSPVAEGRRRGPGALDGIHPQGRSIGPVGLSGGQADAPVDPADASGGPAGEVRAAIRAIRILARLRIPPFRNTCLFRSVAECLVLRRHELPAVVRIGVRTDAETGAVLAHAWVECPGSGAAGGEGLPGDGQAYVVFNPEGAARDRR